MEGGQTGSLTARDREDDRRRGRNKVPGWFDPGPLFWRSYRVVSPSRRSGLGRRVEAQEREQRRHRKHRKQARHCRPRRSPSYHLRYVYHLPGLSSLHLCVLISVPWADCGRSHKLERGMDEGQ